MGWSWRRPISGSAARDGDRRRRPALGERIPSWRRSRCGRCGRTASTSARASQSSVSRRPGGACGCRITQRRRRRQLEGRICCSRPDAGRTSPSSTSRRPASRTGRAASSSTPGSGPSNRRVYAIGDVTGVASVRTPRLSCRHLHQRALFRLRATAEPPSGTPRDLHRSRDRPGRAQRGRREAAHKRIRCCAGPTTRTTGRRPSAPPRVTSRSSRTKGSILGAGHRGRAGRRTHPDLGAGRRTEADHQGHDRVGCTLSDAVGNQPAGGARAMRRRREARWSAGSCGFWAASAATVRG